MLLSLSKKYTAQRKKRFVQLVVGCIGFNATLTRSLQDNKILDWSKLKEFAEDNFKFDENGRKLSKLLENTVRKGEVACYEQFLFFPQCFQKACIPVASKGVIVWEWVKSKGHNGETRVFLGFLTTALTQLSVQSH